MKVFLLLHEMLLVIFSFVIPAFSLLLVFTRTREFGVRLNSLDPWAVGLVLFVLFFWEAMVIISFGFMSIVIENSYTFR